MQTDFQLYKVDMKYIRNLHNMDYSLLILPFLRETGKISDIIRSYVLWNWNGVRQIMRTFAIKQMSCIRNTYPMNFLQAGIAA